jgi:hypothetical protein
MIFEAQLGRAEKKYTKAKKGIITTLSGSASKDPGRFREKYQARKSCNLGRNTKCSAERGIAREEKVFL